MIIFLLLAALFPVQTQAEWISPAHQAAANFAATYKSRANTYNYSVAAEMVDEGFQFKFANGTVVKKWLYVYQLDYHQNHEHFPNGILSAQFRAENGAEIGADLIAKHTVDRTLYTYFFKKYTNLPGGYLLMKAEPSILNALHHAVIFEDQLERLAHGGQDAVDLLMKYFTEDFEFVDLDGKTYQARPFFSRFVAKNPSDYFENPKTAKFDADRNLIVTHSVDHHDFVFVYVQAPQLKGKYQIRRIAPVGK